MFNIRSKEEVLNNFIGRYPDVDKPAKDELGKEYDRYINLLKSLETKEEALEVFQEELNENERRYEDNKQVKALEGASNDRFMDVLESYGMIVFLRDNMIE